MRPDPNPKNFQIRSQSQNFNRIPHNLKKSLESQSQKISVWKTSKIVKKREIICKPNWLFMNNFEKSIPIPIRDFRKIDPNLNPRFWKIDPNPRFWKIDLNLNPKFLKNPSQSEIFGKSISISIRNFLKIHPNPNPRFLKIDPNPNPRFLKSRSHFNSRFFKNRSHGILSQMPTLARHFQNRKSHNIN